MQLKAGRGSGQGGSDGAETLLDAKNILKVDLDVREIGNKLNSKSFTYTKEG